MTTFALVHGAWHGASCWERVAGELEARGHRVVAMDLPCDDPTATFATYADVVLGALAAERGEDVVLVGHSLAGFTIPLVAARRRVTRLVYLCALVPIPGRSHAEQLRLEPDSLLPEYRAGLSRPDDEGRTRWVDERVARRVLYADCDAADARAAFAQLRPQAHAPFTEPWPLAAFPAVPRTYVVCADDRIVSPPWSRAVARARLDAELVELPGGHSPFLSRPAELAALLHERAAAPPAQRGGEEDPLFFTGPEAFEAWLAAHAANSDGVWVRMAKKHTGVASLDWKRGVDVALCFGWIDGRSRRIDDEWFVQRFTPRRARSMWSKVNREKAEALLAAGRMRPEGLAEIERAKADGRWDAAYDGMARAAVPADLARALEDAALTATFAALDGRNRYAILHRVQTARSPDTRARRIAKYVEMLAAGETPY